MYYRKLPTRGTVIGTCLIAGALVAAIRDESPEEGATPRPAEDTSDSPNSDTTVFSAAQFSDFKEKRLEYMREVFRGRYVLRESFSKPAVYVRFPYGEIKLTAKSLDYDTLSLKRAEALAEALPYFPEIYRIMFDGGQRFRMPNSLCRAMEGLKNLETVMVRGGVEIVYSEEAMELLSRHRTLRSLELGGNCQVSEEAFAHLARLRTLTAISVGGNVTPRCLITVAKLPKCTTLLLEGGGEAFSAPIDQDTHQAIASLNGRPFAFGINEVLYRDIDVTLFRALCEIKSLRSLHLCGVRGLTVPDVELLLELNELDHFDLSLSWMEYDVFELERIRNVLDEVRERARRNADRRLGRG